MHYIACAQRHRQARHGRPPPLTADHRKFWPPPRILGAENQHGDGCALFHRVCNMIRPRRHTCHALGQQLTSCVACSCSAAYPVGPAEVVARRREAEASLRSPGRRRGILVMAGDCPRRRWRARSSLGIALATRTSSLPICGADAEASLLDWTRQLAFRIGDQHSGHTARQSFLAKSTNLQHGAGTVLRMYVRTCPHHNPTTTRPRDNGVSKPPAVVVGWVRGRRGGGSTKSSGDCSPCTKWRSSAMVCCSSCSLPYTPSLAGGQHRAVLSMLTCRAPWPPAPVVLGFKQAGDPWRSATGRLCRLTFLTPPLL